MIINVTENEFLVCFRNKITFLHKTLVVNMHTDTKQMWQHKILLTTVQDDIINRVVETSPYN